MNPIGYFKEEPKDKLFDSFNDIEIIDQKGLRL
jgi:hypothetical protein